MEDYLEQYFHTPTQEEKASAIYITWGGYRECTPSHVIGPRVLDMFKIVLVLKGKGFLEQEGNQFQIKAGDLFTLFPGVKHYYYADKNDPWVIMWVSFNGNICSSTLQSIQLTPQTPVIQNANIYPIENALKKIVYEMNTEDPFILKSTGNLYILFSEIKTLSKGKELRPKVEKEEVINKALNFIETNYYLTIDVDIICKYVNYSRSFFSRLFKRHTGITIPQYINNVRIQQAKYLLESTDLSVNDIARSVGFIDNFYFSKVFKASTGLSPKNYKRNIETE